MAAELKAKLLVEAKAIGSAEIETLAQDMGRIGEAGQEAAPRAQLLAAELRALAQQSQEKGIIFSGDTMPGLPICRSAGLTGPRSGQRKTAPGVGLGAVFCVGRWAIEAIGTPGQWRTCRLRLPTPLNSN
jgi:hypothetical protein